MLKKPLSALILVALALGLVAGPHPCSARQEEKGPAASPCHGMASEMDMKEGGHAQSSRAGLPAQGHGPANNCCDIFCQHACQMPAISAVQPVEFAIAPVARTVAESFDPGLALFAHAIDHVPLA